MKQTIKEATLLKIIDNVDTPCFVYNQDLIEEKVSDYHKNFLSDKFKTELIYASKAFQCDALIQLLQNNDFSIDTVSYGEIFHVLKNNFPPSKIYFHGNNKTDKEINYALENKIGHFIIDNENELDRIIKCANLLKRGTNIIIRVNPGIDAHTHSFISTALVDSKFGIHINEIDKIVNLIKKISNCEYLNFEGFHSHIGSNIKEMNPYYKQIDVIINLIKVMKCQGIETKVLDIGGGYYAKYNDEDSDSSVSNYAKLIIQYTETVLFKKNIKIDKVCIEPGRSIVAEAGITLYTVGDIKQTKNKTYAFIDGGMTDNLRVALYQANYTCDVLGKEDDDKTNVYTIAGHCCESSDILIEEIHLPKLNSGDVLIFYTTGAYGYSMSNHYNKHELPPVVFVKDDKARIVIKREPIEDLVRLEVNEPIE